MRILLFLLVVQGYAAFNLTWGAPAVNLDSNPPLGDTDMNAAIAIDPLGNAVAVWARTDSGQAVQDIWGAFYNHSSRVWTGAMLVSGGTNAAYGQVAMDEEGNSLFIWEEGFPTKIIARVLHATGVWGEAEIVRVSTKPQVMPQLAMDQTGRAVAIWMEYYDEAYRIYSAKRDVNGVWNDLGEISKGSRNVQLNATKAIAMNRTGEAFAAWEEGDEIHTAIYLQGIWSKPYSVSVGGNGKGYAPAIAIDGDGNGLVVWCQGHTVYSKRCVNGSWSDLLIVSNPDYPAARPDVAMDGEGNAIAVFERSDALHKFICGAALNVEDTEWSKPSDISPPSLAHVEGAGYPVLAVNEIGDGVVVWKEYDGETMVIQGAGYSLDTWSVTKSLSAKGCHAAALFAGYDIDVAINTAGSIIALWPEDPIGNGSQQIKTTFGVGLANMAPPPPTADLFTLENGIASGRQVAHKFPAHLDLINMLSWSTTTPVSYYRIYRGHLANLIGTSNSGTYEDHSRALKKKETYLITAVDENEQESAPLTLIVHPK